MTKSKQTAGWMSGETKKVFVSSQKKQQISKKLFYGAFALCTLLAFSLGAGFIVLFTTTALAFDAESPQVAHVEEIQVEEIVQTIPVFMPEREPLALVLCEPHIEECILPCDNYITYNKEIIDIEDIAENNTYIEHIPYVEDITEDITTYYEPTYDLPEPVVFVPVLQSPIPQARCYFKSWMDWRAITNRNSRQWRMQQIAYTCNDGFRRVDGLYMIALGTYFLYSGVGDVFDITLSSGVTFRAVVGDVKSDRHTDPTNRFHISDGSVIEFVVDRQVMCSRVLSMGNMSYAGFQGSIESVVRVPELFIAV